MKRQTDKKPYQKPLVTRVRLSVEHNVLQSCRSVAEPGMSPYAYPECYIEHYCLDKPTL
jgi:hypothetical protein